MTHKDTEVMHIEMSPEAVQMGFAQVLSEQLKVSGHDDIDDGERRSDLCHRFARIGECVRQRVHGRDRPPEPASALRRPRGRPRHGIVSGMA